MISAEIAKKQEVLYMYLKRVPFRNEVSIYRDPSVVNSTSHVNTVG